MACWLLQIWTLPTPGSLSTVLQEKKENAALNNTRRHFLFPCDFLFQHPKASVRYETPKKAVKALVPPAALLAFHPPGSKPSNSFACAYFRHSPGLRIPSELFIRSERVQLRKIANFDLHVIASSTYYANRE